MTNNDTQSGGEEHDVPSHHHSPASMLPSMGGSLPHLPTLPYTNAAEKFYMSNLLARTTSNGKITFMKLLIPLDN